MKAIRVENGKPAESAISKSLDTPRYGLDVASDVLCAEGYNVVTLMTKSVECDGGRRKSAKRQSVLKRLLYNYKK